MTSAPSLHPKRDRAAFAKLAGVPGVEVLSARFMAHRFGPHTHDAWAFGAVSKGAQDLSGRDGAQSLVKAGEVSIIPPGEVHAGRVVGSAACEYVMLYVPDAMIQDYALDLGLGRLDSAMRAVSTPLLSAQMGTLVQTVVAGDPHDLLSESEWLTLLGSMLSQFAPRRPGRDAPPAGSPAMRRAFSLLHARWAESVSIGQLAAEAGMSPAYFCRQFSRIYGLSPHRYQLVLRVNRAKTMIAAGIAIAEVADATGFADQSHLGRHLKNCLGITPGEIAR